MNVARQRCECGTRNTCEKADARYGSDPAARRNNPTRDVVDRTIEAMNATQPPPASGAPR